jgi:hypothetical protein
VSCQQHQNILFDQQLATANQPVQCVVILPVSCLYPSVMCSAVLLQMASEAVARPRLAVPYVPGQTPPFPVVSVPPVSARTERTELLCPCPRLHPLSLSLAVPAHVSLRRA